MNDRMPTTYLLTGSNLGDREKNLQQARQQIITAIGRVTQTSRVYETAAWGRENQPAFLNQVLAVRTHLTPPALLTEINRLEDQLGRVRDIPWGARLIDIDILFYGELVLQTQRLTIPHPEIPHRRFTLVPLTEIAPDFRHPVLGQTTAQLLARCPDTLAVTVFSESATS